ncbi:hypothetical protein [Acidovorax sp. BLS4]|uniref:hypothetical protein n=1 Tax=Acidovorax sp. BLS4 TaxID=3273430 RepID=UPI00294302FD|nr:hypothetical protein [Paracidovorax avenae]WOI45564.1 hypothetical protein R1Z03_24350 [Paracidovorax avenae]
MSGSNRLQNYTQTFQPASGSAQTSTVAYSHDATGSLTKKGDNYLHYGSDGRIAKAGLNADPANALAVSYTYNALGQRVFKSDARLSGANNPAITQQTVYAEDGIGSTVLGQYGNRRSSNSAAPASGSNRLQNYTQTFQPASGSAQTSTVAYSHDATGALTKKGDNYLHYGSDGRIAKAGLNADPANALAVSYTYNALGQRVFKSDARLSGANNPAITQQTVHAEDGIGSTVLGQYGNRRSSNSAAPALFYTQNHSNSKTRFLKGVAFDGTQNTRVVYDL